MSHPKRSSFPCPQIVSDIDARGMEYVSPATGKMITSRAERREDLKRSGCREVDPSEHKPEYRQKKYAKRFGGSLDKWNPEAGPFKR